MDLLDHEESTSLKQLIHIDILPSKRVYQFIIPIDENGVLATPFASTADSYFLKIMLI